MAAKTDLELALADLEAGKFSFRMVEAIKSHVAALEGDLARVNGAYESAGKTLREQEYKISRLEADLRKLNARVYALVKANALTETAMREGKRGALASCDLLVVMSQHAFELSKKALVSLSAVDAKAKTGALAQEARAGLAQLDLQGELEKLKSHPLAEKALRELQTCSGKAQEYPPVARKQLAALLGKAAAFIEKLHKNAA